MIIQTRYRDIPFEDVEHWKDKPRNSYFRWSQENWPRVRGASILVALPPVNERPTSDCKQPIFARVNPDGSRFINANGRPVAVCTCVAEIGD